jgi:hypothetical protein
MFLITGMWLLGLGLLSSSAFAEAISPRIHNSLSSSGQVGTAEI